MSESRADEATRLLQRMGQGDPAVAERLMQVLYAELHAVADKLMARERTGHTMQPTALVHEAFLRLVDEGQREWDSRVHFLRVAARAMRNALVDHARARLADKRGGGRWHQVTLVDDVAPGGHDVASLLTVDETLSRLAEIDPQLAELVELRFFGGLDNKEIAAALDTSLRTVERGWRTARAWLLHEMKGDGGGP